MASDLSIVTVSLDIAWADRDENLSTIESVTKNLPAGVDLALLPELCTTGFIADTNTIELLAETNSGLTIERLRKISRDSGVALAGSFLARSGNDIFNRAFFIEPSGEETFYNKAHLFSLSSESQVMTAGRQRSSVIRYRGWNIAMIVCYDLRFPVWCRGRGTDYDIMLVPANWPKSREYAWRQLMIARAIENQAVYVGCNRGGSDDFGQYDDMSMIVDAMGKPVSKSMTVDSVAGKIKIEYAVLSKRNLEECRLKLPFQNDADDFTL